MRGFLLDTHALLWWWTDDARLSPRIRDVLVRESRPVHVSAATAWEISTKLRLGKLGLPKAVDAFDELVRQDGFTQLNITWLHARRAGEYDCDHRDPFDRMLAAQAEMQNLTLISADPALKHFPVQLHWL